MRQKINISTHLSTSLEAVYKSFIISQTSRGISDATITNYHSHLRGIAKHLDITIPNLKEKDTVKETYTDKELSILLARPQKGADFCEYRNWVIINYLLNSGCRAATVRNIQNRDVDLETRQVV